MIMRIRRAENIVNRERRFAAVGHFVVSDTQFVYRPAKSDERNRGRVGNARENRRGNSGRHGAHRINNRRNDVFVFVKPDVKCSARFEQRAQGAKSFFRIRRVMQNARRVNNIDDFGRQAADFANRR